MEQVFLTVLNMSITASYAMLIVCALRFVFKRHAPKVVFYALWIVVLFRLVCPVSFSSSVSFLGVSTGLDLPAPVDGAMHYIPQNIGLMEEPTVQIGPGALNDALSGSLPAATPEASGNPMQVLLYVATIVWASGLVIMLLYSVVSYLRLKKKVSTATRVEGNVFETDAITSPFVFGLIRPRIYLPVGLSEEQRRFVLLHERTHVRRLDYLVKPVAFIALGIHWFNPLMWVMFCLMSQDMEMICDESAIKELNASARADYSHALLSLCTGRSALTGSPVAFGESHAKSRIENVLHYKKPTLVIVAVAIVAAVVLSVCLIANPAQAEGLSLLNYEQFQSVAYQTETIAVNVDGEDLRSEGQVLGDYLQQVNWKQSYAPTELEPPSITFYLSDDYQLRLYSQQTRLAQIVLNEQSRYYRTGPDDYQRALSELERAWQLDAVNSAVSRAILDELSGAFLPGQHRLEAHELLGTQTDGDVLICYAVARYGEYDVLEDGTFSQVSGMDTTPLVIRFNQADLSLQSLTLPEDGSRYIPSIRELFEEPYLEQALSAGERYGDALDTQIERQLDQLIQPDSPA